MVPGSAPDRAFRGVPEQTKVALLGPSPLYRNLLATALVASGVVVLANLPPLDIAAARVSGADVAIFDCGGMDLGGWLWWLNSTLFGWPLVVSGVTLAPELADLCPLPEPHRIVAAGSELDDLLTAISEVASDRPPVTFQPTTADAESGSDAPYARLSRQERQVARLAAAGLSNKEIAAKLFLEVSTVKNHMHRVLTKLEVTRRGDIVAALINSSPRGNG